MFVVVYASFIYCQRVVLLRIESEWVALFVLRKVSDNEKKQGFARRRLFLRVRCFVLFLCALESVNPIIVLFASL